MNSTSESTMQARSTLLALPVELKLEIISHLPHDEYPSRACLRRTHSSFLELVPKADIRSKLSDTDLSYQLLKTELDYAYLFPPDHYPCYFCARVLPLEAFGIDALRDVGNLMCKAYIPHRSCKDCLLSRQCSYKRSFIESLTWIGWTPQLRSITNGVVLMMPEELNKHLAMLRRLAWDPSVDVKKGRGLTGTDEAKSTIALDSEG